MNRILHQIFLFILTVLSAAPFTACIDDSVTTSGSAQPEFSADTLSLGAMWAGETSPTAMMRIYNRQSKGIILSKVAVAGCAAGTLRLNLDGVSGTEFGNIGIRANDSLFLLAEAVPSPGFKAAVEITANGVTHTIPVSGNAIDPVELNDFTVSGDYTIPAGSAVRVRGNLTVADGATLTVGEGTTLYFRDKAKLVARGHLIARGTPTAQITLRGDRLGNVVTSIPFDVMAGQWEGMEFTEGSAGSELTGVSVVNTCSGITLSEGADLTLTNCRISNSQATVITSTEAMLTATGCELTNAATSLLLLSGGETRLDRCTLSNHYLFSFPSGAAITVEGGAALEVNESIIHGDGAELSAPTPLAQNIVFTRCLFGAPGKDDASFIGCIWQADPLFRLDLNNYVMDFRLADDSPARGKATTSCTDRLGVGGTALGAYN